MVVGKVGEIFSKDVKMWGLTTPVDLSICGVDFGIQHFVEKGQRDLCLEVSRQEFSKAREILEELDNISHLDDVDVSLQVLREFQPGDWVLSDAPYTLKELLK